MRRLGVAVAALLLIGSACTSTFAKDNPQLCSNDKIQLIKDAVARDGLTPQAAADKVGTDARCLSDDETKQAQATFAAFKARATTAPTQAAATAIPTTAAPTAAPSPSASATTNAASTQAPTEQPTAAPTETPKPATPTPTASPSPTPSPSPSPTLAAGDAGWPAKSITAIGSNEAPITGRVVHANGTGAGHHCMILTSSTAANPCAATTDANGNFTLKFGFPSTIDLIVKGQYDPSTGDGPVVAHYPVNFTLTGVGGITINIP